MTVEDLETLFRARFKDKNTKRPAVSSDDYLMYLNEAQDEACARGIPIFDRWAPYCTIPVIADTKQYSLNKSVISVKRAFIGSIELPVVTVDAMDAISSDWRSWPSGTPRYVIVYPTTIELVPTPDANTTLLIDVYRFAKKLTSTAVEPEIPRAFHPALNEWVLHRAYSLPDEDTSNPTKSVEAMSRFESVFGGSVMAKDYQDRYVDQPHVNRVFI